MSSGDMAKSSWFSSKIKHKKISVWYQNKNREFLKIFEIFSDNIYGFWWVIQPQFLGTSSFATKVVGDVP